MNQFKAYRIHQQDDGVRADFEMLTIDQLTAGDVTVQVAYSGINYKDALAVSGRGKILRHYPLNGGIDMSGVVVESDNAQFKVGDRVMACGVGLSEFYDGGFAEFTRLPATQLTPVPDGLSLRDVMAIGTAGFTAALALERITANGQTTDNGPMLVTGATGGVGSFALSLLSAEGYQTVALTGKPDEAEYLTSIGANTIMDRREINDGKRPLEKALWGGAIDNLGGETLAWLSRTVKPWGNIACIGLAQGTELNTTVMPLILRGVSLVGVNVMELPSWLADQSWGRLASRLNREHLAIIAPREIAFDDLPGAFDAYIKGSNTRRAVVVINADL